MGDGANPYTRIDAIDIEAMEKHVQQLKRKGQKWIFIQIYNVVLVYLMHTAQRLRSIHLGRTCFKWIHDDLSMCGFNNNNTHAHTHKWRLSLPLLVSFCSTPWRTSQASHHTWHAIIIHKQTNKYISISRMESGFIVGHILFRRNVLACLPAVIWVNEVHSEHAHK